jgi:mannose/fructose/N-acetylgalactosamine-specific phosphotransferase system component IIC
MDFINTHVIKVVLATLFIMVEVLLLFFFKRLTTKLKRLKGTGRVPEIENTNTNKMLVKAMLVLIPCLIVFILIEI